jgi:hypothetical protein
MGAAKSAPDSVPSFSLLQFLQWIAARPRTYGEVMEAWRTSCPRLSVWEDATADNLIEVNSQGTASYDRASVLLTERGAALLRAEENGGEAAR